LTEPVFIRDEVIETNRQDRHWIKDHVARARKLGADAFRVTMHPTEPRRILLEGWADRVPLDQGEPRWLLEEWSPNGMKEKSG
jgi:hypothetical protein